MIYFEVALLELGDGVCNIIPDESILFTDQPSAMQVYGFSWKQTEN